MYGRVGAAVDLHLLVRRLLDPLEARLRRIQQVPREAVALRRDPGRGRDLDRLAQAAERDGVRDAERHVVRVEEVGDRRVDVRTVLRAERGLDRALLLRRGRPRRRRGRRVGGGPGAADRGAQAGTCERASRRRRAPP